MSSTRKRKIDHQRDHSQNKKHRNRDVSTSKDHKKKSKHQSSKEGTQYTQFSGVSYEEEDDIIEEEVEYHLGADDIPHKVEKSSSSTKKTKDVKYYFEDEDTKSRGRKHKKEQDKMKKKLKKSRRSPSSESSSDSSVELKKKKSKKKNRKKLDHSDEKIVKSSKKSKKSVIKSESAEKHKKKKNKRHPSPITTSTGNSSNYDDRPPKPQKKLLSPVKKKSSTKVKSMNANQEHHDKTNSDVTQKKNRHDEGKRNQDKEDLRKSISEQHNKRMQQELHVSNRKMASHRTTTSKTKYLPGMMSQATRDNYKREDDVARRDAYSRNQRSYQEDREKRAKENGSFTTSRRDKPNLVYQDDMFSRNSTSRNPEKYKRDGMMSPRSKYSADGDREMPSRQKVGYHGDKQRGEYREELRRSHGNGDSKRHQIGYPRDQQREARYPDRNENRSIKQRRSGESFSQQRRESSANKRDDSKNRRDDGDLRNNLNMRKIENFKITVKRSDISDVATSSRALRRDDGMQRNRVRRSPLVRTISTSNRLQNSNKPSVHSRLGEGTVRPKRNLNNSSLRVKKNLNNSSLRLKKQMEQQQRYQETAKNNSGVRSRMPRSPERTSNARRTSDYFDSGRNVRGGRSDLRPKNLGLRSSAQAGQNIRERSGNRPEVRIRSGMRQDVRDRKGVFQESRNRARQGERSLFRSGVKRTDGRMPVSRGINENRTRDAKRSYPNLNRSRSSAKRNSSPARKSAKYDSNLSSRNSSAQRSDARSHASSSSNQMRRKQMTSSRGNEITSSKRQQEKRSKDEKSTRIDRERKLVDKSAGKSSKATKRDDVVKSSSDKVASLKKENGDSGKEASKPDWSTIKTEKPKHTDELKNSEEKKTVFDKFKPCNLLRSMSVSTRILPDELIEKIKSITSETGKPDTMLYDESGAVNCFNTERCDSQFEISQSDRLNSIAELHMRNRITNFDYAYEDATEDFYPIQQPMLIHNDMLQNTIKLCRESFYLACN